MSSIPLLLWALSVLQKPPDYIRFYELRNAADYQCQIRHNAVKTLRLLEQAEAIKELDADAEEMRARCYLDLGDTTHAMSSVKASIRIGNPNTARLYTDFKDLNARCMRELQDSCPDLIRQYYCNLNIPVLLQLNAMYSRDQFIRSYHRDLKAQEEESLFRTVDSLNLCRLKAIYLQYGILRYPQTFVIFWHALFKFPALWAYFEPEMRKGIYTGLFHPQGYAMLFDKIRVETEKKNSWYGEYTNSDSFTVLGPIDEIGQVDERRKAIGLRPLIEMSKLYEWVLPPGYHPPPANPENN